MAERASARRLDACQKRIATVQMQMKQAAEERDVLDGQLPAAGGPMAARLVAAEKELAALEELLPLETRHAAAIQDAAAAGQRWPAPSRSFRRRGAARARCCARPACRRGLRPSA